MVLVKHAQGNVVCKRVERKMGREQHEEGHCSELELTDCQLCCWKFSHGGDTV